MIFPFSHYLYEDENEAVQRLLDGLNWPQELSEGVHASATGLVRKTREQKKGGRLEAFLQEFSLNTEEGLAMMCLAEALLRIPDAHTANLLIKDKVVAAQWLQNQGDSKDWMAKAAGIGMALTRKTLDSSLSRLGEPVIREAMIKAMQMMGKQFVLGTDIDDAMSHARQWERQGYRMSYDMLGEGARDADTAERYFQAYRKSIDRISANNGQKILSNAGISVKLSALHPRYEFAQKERCIPEIAEKLHALALQAKQSNMPLTVDAEEAARLDISIEIFERVLASADLAGWDGLGLAIQAYQKRALPLIEYVAERAREHGRKIQIRLVKGAYWDTEIKIAQMGGYPEYPVFTRKANTDVSYLACAQKMLALRDVIYPMFATHNAHTIAAVLHMASGESQGEYEFQRLHGMGENLYAQVLADHDARVSVYAPVGPHRDLLPYLVRRLLENGANSSFVNQILDKGLEASDIVKDPVSVARNCTPARNNKIPLPNGIFGQNRVSSAGVDLDDPVSSADMLGFIKSYDLTLKPCSYMSGKPFEDGSEDLIPRAFQAAKTAFPKWRDSDIEHRSEKLEKIADLLEENMSELMAILVHEAGKTIPDAVDEVREAVDFCRYYAANAREDFKADGILMPGYTGEENRLMLQGRGVFVCVSPWNFPLAIFTGQIVAALVTGNCVIAKPASQTRAIATRTVQIMHEAGIPADVLHLLIGDGAYGGQIVAHKGVAGVVFTGSTATAKRIQATLSSENPAIVPLIAETGGQNAMIVDSSALPEQVVDDVIHSAFGSAGQRCSALRVLYLQNDIADTVITLLKGAMRELRVSEPSDISVDIGYVIDQSAKRVLDDHVDYIEGRGALVARAPLSDDSSDFDRLFAPVAYEIPNISVLREEVFGPVLHIIRFEAADLKKVIEDINSSGYGLTFGMHSRIKSQHDYVASRINAGNIYINRSTTGAIVGVQPFGGMGLSGTGPKAGGPHYLHAFATEKVVTIDTTASGGNASLISMSE